MLAAPRIPELAQRDRFVRRAVKEGRVLTLADEQSASVASQKFAGRTVQLFWSSAIEAKRWAEALTGEADLQNIPLVTFAAEILPSIAASRGLAGTDWVADPIEAEVDPRDLILRLKTEAVPEFLKSVLDRGEIYLVAGAEGPLLQATARRGGSGRALQVFVLRGDAERHMKRVGGVSITVDPITDFLGSTLPWAADRHHGLLIEPIAGAGPLELSSAELRSRLMAA